MKGLRGPVGWVVVGGLLAGALDITFACTWWAIARDLPAQRIFQSVASGLLGKASFDGGWTTALLGLALHFLIALAMSVAYYAASRRIVLLWQKPVALGAAYGLLLYGVMNFVVVPLSNAAGRPWQLDPWTLAGIAAHVLLVGIPIALCARRASAGLRA